MFIRLGFTAPAAGLLVNDQSMDDIDELKLLSDEEKLTHLSKLSNTLAA